MKITKTTLPGVLPLEPKLHGDNRGFTRPIATTFFEKQGAPGRAAWPTLTAHSATGETGTGRKRAGGFRINSRRLTARIASASNRPRQAGYQTENVMNNFFQDAPPGIITNTAYSAVDQADSEPELAYVINRDGATNLAQACADNNIPLLHISTD